MASELTPEARRLCLGANLTKTTVAKQLLLEVLLLYALSHRTHIAEAAQ